MAYDQSELPHIGPTRREIRKARKERRKIINAPGVNLGAMFSEGPRFIQAILRKKQKN